MGRHPKQLVQGECGCRYVKGKRIRCELHELRHNIYTYPIRPRCFVVPPDAILAMGRGVKDPLARALFFFIYLTGARINEARDFSMNRVVVSDGRLTIRMKTLKQRKGIVYRQVPVPIGGEAKCHEPEMWAEVSSYLQGFSGFQQPFGKNKNMSDYLRRAVEPFQVEANVRIAPKQYVDQRITKKFYPHYLRHARASHLDSVYHFSETQLCRFFGWAKADMAVRYTRQGDVWAGFKGGKP